MGHIRDKGTNEEEPHQFVIDHARRELASGTNNAPNDGGCPKHCRTWAAETIFLMRRADIVDIAEYP